MIQIIKTITVGFLAISVLSSLVTLSIKLNKEMHIAFSIMAFLVVIVVSYFTGKILI